MSDDDRSESGKRAAVNTRTMEVVVAVLLLVIGGAVAIDSFRIGARWGDDGPQSGYFPFYIGLIICIASIVNIISALGLGAKGRKPFVMRSQLKMVLVVIVPCAGYVALIANPLYSFGIYEPSALFIAAFMRILGKYAWPKIALVSLGVVIAFFLMFEVWFQVPLPKGPIEALLGFE